MLQTLINIIAIFAISLNLFGCNIQKPYTKADFFESLKVIAGFNEEEELVNYGLIEVQDLNKRNENLDYDYAYDVLSILITKEEADRNVLKECGLLESFKTGLANKDVIEDLLKAVVYYINHQNFETKLDLKVFEYKTMKEEKDFKNNDLVKDDTYYIVEKAEDDNYELREAKFEEIYSNAKFSYSGDLNFDNVEILSESESIPKFEYEDDVLVRKNDDHYTNVKEIDGYRISYSFKRGSLYFYVSKKMDNGVNTFFNTKISNIRPSFKWDYEKGNIKQAYFKLDYKTHENFGFSCGKYKRYYADFASLKDDSEKSLIDKLTGLVKTNNNFVKTSFTICRLRIPIPEMPSVSISLDLKLNFYISGEVGISLETINHQGFEINNNQLRFINDNVHDIDGYSQANASATISLTTALELATYKLMDIGVKAGVKAKIKVTAHLLDDKAEVDVPYAIANELLEDKGIPICGDLSLYWVLDLFFNSEATLASRVGISKSLSLLDEDNQIFNNLSHIENGMFVEHCTRKRQEFIKPELDLNPNEILLKTYSVVMKQEYYQIEVLALPNSYTKEDLCYEVDKAGIVIVDQKGLVKSLCPGAAKIHIFTKDHQYEVYINILVSTNQLGIICLSS